MTKARITGILIFIAALALDYFIESEKFDFVYGALMGIGIMLIIIGKFRKEKI